MLQRPQSILLLIVITNLLVVGCMSAVHVQAVGAAGLYPGRMLLLGVCTGVLSFLAAGTAVYTLSRYDHRGLQLKFGILNTVAMVLLTGLTAYLFIHKAATLLCVAAVVSNVLANRCIRQDEELVKAADRIR